MAMDGSTEIILRRGVFGVPGSLQYLILGFLNKTHFTAAGETAVGV